MIFIHGIPINKRHGKTCQVLGVTVRLEARYTSASEHVERLTPSHMGMISLLAKAFRGELVGKEK